MTPSPGIEPGPHWWKASALTTAPSLHPKYPQISFWELNSIFMPSLPFVLVWNIAAGHMSENKIPFSKL